MHKEDCSMIPKQIYRLIQEISGATDEDARFMVPLFAITLTIVLLLAIAVLL